MRSYQEFKNRLKEYEGVKYIYEDYGYIAWQVSTGENVELMFIEVAEPRKGYGTKLLKEMLRQINPYNSVFVFRLASNDTAGKFYRKMGFTETPIRGLYTEDAVLGVASYKQLCQNLSIQ